MPDMEIILLSELAEFVPWAAELAVITAVNTIAYEGSKFQGNARFKLDGEIGNAASSI